MGKRFITRIELSAQSRRFLTSYPKEAGMTQVAVLSRLVEWFAEQPNDIQIPILSQRDVERDSQLTLKVIKQFAKKAGKR